MPSTLFIADPVSAFHPQAETTFYLMSEAQRRGLDVWHVLPDQLSSTNSGVFARCRRLVLSNKKGSFSAAVKEERKLDLSTPDVIWLRKDPPVDVAYLDHLTILERLESKTLFINRPSGVKKGSEKIYPLLFPEWNPPTLISRDEGDMLAFLKTHKKVVVKPLHESGGRGIVILTDRDEDKKSVLELATSRYADYVSMQRFVTDAKKGDKRILLMGGSVLGCFLRVPAKGDFRGNMHSGAKWVKSALTSRDEKMLDDVVPQLLSDGLSFVGLDVLGGYLTEINTTSPMGIREINSLYRKQAEREIWDMVGVDR